MALPTHNNYYNPTPITPPRRPRKRRFRRLVLPVILLACGIIIAQHFAYITHASGNSASSKRTVSPSPSAQQLASLQNQINADISANPNIDTAVSVINLNNSQSYQYGITDPFEAASTSKLLTAADFLRHTENGSASLNDTVNGQTARYELQQMIEVSDDNAWQAFNDQLGHPDLLSYASGAGLTNYDPDNNTLPSNDIAILLEKLYRGQLLDQADTKLMLGYMAKANYTGYMGSVMPGDVTFYHKAGVLNDRIHDAAIATNGKQTLVIVVFTKNENNAYQADPAQAQIIQQITKAVLQAYGVT